jgi:1-phosphofructokinase family hexose kinase
MQLLTVTPNVALDRTLTLAGWQKGAISRTDQILVAAGGKGLNVARAALCLGLGVTAAGLLGGATGQMVARLAEAEGIEGRWMWLPAGETRTCLILIDQDEPSATVINEAGPTISPESWAELEALVVRESARADVTAFCGSVPPGIEPAAFGRTLDRLNDLGRALAVDSSGPTLREALHRPVWMVKVNHEELGLVLGQTLDTPEAVGQAARQLRAQGPRRVIVTMGALGAVCCTDEGVWWAEPPALPTISTVGAGDSFLAGLMVGRMRGNTWADALTMAVACGSSDAMSIGGGLIEPEQVSQLCDQVRCQRLGE